MDFQSTRDKNVRLVENRLREILMPRRPEKIYEAMTYSVFNGGKRIRPLLLLASCEAAGGSGAALDFACAVEMIHCYSLIHDDLPAMDNDDFRRGKPTNHKIYGEAMAILAGDALLNTAYELMSACVSDPVTVCAMQEIAWAAGTGGMLGGQVVDLEYQDKLADAGALLFIHTHKTGALISASMTAGARLGGADEATLKDYGEAAAKLGLAFQIKDDILDMTSTDQELGKPVGSDVKNKKLTYVSLYGLEKARQDCDRLSKNAADAVEELFDPVAAGFLRGLIEALTTRSM